MKVPPVCSTFGAALGSLPMNIGKVFAFSREQTFCGAEDLRCDGPWMNLPEAQKAAIETAQVLGMRIVALVRVSTG